MSEYMHLLGSEQVSSAAYVIRDAASDMQRAANSIDDTLTRFLRNFESLVERLEALKESRE